MTISLQHAQTLFHQGNFSQTLEICHQLTEQHSENSNFWLLYGLTLAKLQRYNEALSTLKQSYDINKNYNNTLSLGQLYLVLNKLDKAEQFLLDAFHLNSDAGEAAISLANLYSLKNLHSQALPYFEHAQKYLKNDPNFLGNFAITLERLRMHDRATQIAKAAIHLSESSPTANLVLARIERSNKQYEKAENILEAAISKQTSPVHAVNLYGELGIVKDRQGKYNEAMTAFDTCNKIWQTISKSADFDKQYYSDRIKKLQTLNPTCNPAGIPYKNKIRLVFFVGFPRSGTTLVEQILKTSPHVITTQEEPLITDLIDSSFHPNTSYPERLNTLSEEDILEIREKYLTNLFRITKSPSSQEETIYIDKLPLNIIELAFITQIFPEAKILVAIRDPRDVCLSCYMQSFKINPAMIHFLSLEDTAIFYAQTMGLWNHYKNTIPNLDFMEYRYEDLVENLENVSKKITQFIGLKWSTDVLNYHIKAGKDVVSTPSFIDVTKPIYKRAKGRWRNYSESITPIEPILRPFIDQFGYSSNST